jgi:hypothetical protein
MTWVSQRRAGSGSDSVMAGSKPVGETAGRARPSQASPMSAAATPATVSARLLRVPFIDAPSCRAQTSAGRGSSLTRQAHPCRRPPTLLGWQSEASRRARRRFTGRDRDAGDSAWAGSLELRCQLADRSRVVQVTDSRLPARHAEGSPSFRAGWCDAAGFYLTEADDLGLAGCSVASPS